MAKRKSKKINMLIRKSDNTVTTRDQREAKLIELLPIFGWTEAARKAGYSKTYAANIKEGKCRSKRFMSKLFEAGDEAIAMARPYSALQYQQYQKIRGNVLQKSATQKGYVEEHSTLVTRMGEQMARDCGLREDEKPRVQVIDVKSLTFVQNFFAQQQQSQKPGLELLDSGEEIIDAEVLQESKIVERKDAEKSN
jgi:hypothetical protein